MAKASNCKAVPTSGTNYSDWGLTPYPTALHHQLELVERRSAGAIEDCLIFTEHPPTYTIGARQGAERHLLANDEQLQQLGIQLVKTSRGGDITYHGPGQLVGYPIVSLAATRDLHRFLRDLEQVLINALGKIGLAVTRREGKTGIWLAERKICAMGIAVKKWVTYHGFAINVNNDLGPFDHIVPCGISPADGSVTSMAKELRRRVDMQALKAVVADAFWQIFAE